MNELYGVLFTAGEGGIDLLIYSWICCNEIAEDFPRIRPYWSIDYTRNERIFKVRMFPCLFVFFVYPFVNNICAFFARLKSFFNSDLKTSRCFRALPSSSLSGFGFFLLPSQNRWNVSATGVARAK
jgi:hypothetical protein